MTTDRPKHQLNRCCRNRLLRRDRAPSRTANSADELGARHRSPICRACSHKSRRGTPAPNVAQGSDGQLPGRLDPRQLPQSHRTALLSHQPLGSAEIIHPFHPLRGQRFVVLKVRRVAGVETLSLRHHDLGSFAMAREWTDWAPPGAPAVSAGKSLMIDAFGLLSLTELVTSLTRNGGLDR